jgi:uncharacterized protein (TIGR00730 family)
MKSICVFCAASNAIDPRYLKLAAETGRFVADKSWQLVYGGARGGMMGAMANAALERGGKVSGVIPEVLGPQESAHMYLTKLIVVADMHERQKKMAEMADAFIILPGGMGTLAEFFEIVTWKAIGLHTKKIAVINAYGYWDHLLAQMQHSEDERFLHVKQAALYNVFEEIEALGRFFENSGL